ncbi:MAG: hypothetical protein V1834_03690, partial [Candidatus Micrarchaeota archaeon]
MKNYWLLIVVVLMLAAAVASLKPEPTPQVSSVQPMLMQPSEYQESKDVEVTKSESTQGVIALNPDKNYYDAGDEALLAITVLNSFGNTVCDAELKLVITEPLGKQAVLTTENGLIQKGGDCGALTEVEPDYVSEYELGSAGVYQLRLTAETSEGVQLLSSSIAVLQAPFKVARSGPTRIYPQEKQVMLITVEASRDYAGKITERVPASFEITPREGMRVFEEGEFKFIEWSASLKKGEARDFVYEFQAPVITPFLFKVGPLSIGTSSENREWLIASDATTNLIMLWDGASGAIPAPWVCISCTPGSQFYDRYIYAADSYSEQAGGGVSHAHTYTLAATGTANVTTLQNSGLDYASSGHTHAFSPVIATASNLPSYRNLTVIRYDSGSGIPTTLPLGVIGLFNATVPANWVQYSDQNGYYIRGSDAPNGTAGSNTHNHALSGTLDSPGSDEVATGKTGAANFAVDLAHSHSLASGQTTNTSNSEPPFKSIILGKLTVDGDTLPNGLIGMFNSTVLSTDWTIISGSGGAMYQKFLKASSSYGTTGGESASSHANLLTLYSTAGGTSAAKVGTGAIGAGESHYHTNMVILGINSSSNFPLYSQVILAYYNAPAALKIAQFRIYEDNTMVIGGGGAPALRCNITSNFGSNLADYACDNATNGNLQPNTMHRAEFRICNDGGTGAKAATAGFFDHNLTTNKEYQIGTFGGNGTACYYWMIDGAPAGTATICTYEPNTGVMSAKLVGFSIPSGTAHVDGSCDWIAYNFTTGSPSNQVKGQSSANTTGVSSGSDPNTGILNATIRNPLANVVISHFRIYESSAMTLAAGTMRCNTSSNYGSSVGDIQCNTTTGGGNLTYSTMHRAEFQLCNDQVSVG